MGNISSGISFTLVFLLNRGGFLGFGVVEHKNTYADQHQGKEQLQGAYVGCFVWQEDAGEQHAKERRLL